MDNTTESGDASRGGQQNLSGQRMQEGGQAGTGSAKGEGSESASKSAVSPSRSESRPATRSNVGVLRPPVDVIEDALGITLVADIPGVSRDNLNLRFESQSLTIEGAMSLDFPETMESRHAEVRHQHYERTFALSKELDGEQATAELKHGVLRVRIPKTQQAMPRKIPVTVA